MKTHLVKDFYEKSGKMYRTDDAGVLLQRCSFVEEEAKELYREAAELSFGFGDYENLLKEIGDVLYTIIGVCGTIGVDPSVIFNRVADSNMSKVNPPAFNNEGKIIKGPNYKPPTFGDLV